MSKHFNAAYACLTPAMVRLAIFDGGLRWEMHPCQLASLEMSCVADIGMSKVEDHEIMPTAPSLTMMGIPIQLSAEYPKDLVRLVAGPQEVYRIECLPTPIGF